MSRCRIYTKKYVFAIFVVGIILSFQKVSIASSKGYDFTIIPAGAEYVPGEILVRFAPKAGGIQRDTTEKTQILSSLGGGVIKHTFKIVPGLTLVKLPSGLTVKDALKTFNRTDGILHAQPNYIYKADSTFPNDPNFAQLWGMHNTGQTSGSADADIDAPEAWDIATDSNIIVAVIDTGVDYNHPDLAANMWTNANGYHGYDFRNNDNYPMDDCGHGTHCAGIIGARGNNGVGVTGVCWNVKIMALKFLDYTGSNGDTADAIACINYAVNNGAKVLSNSWGGPYDPDLRTAIENAGTAGVLFIASAGNTGIDNDNDEYPNYPASYDCNNIISVMATDSNDARSIWSYYSSTNWGAASVDLAAPGSVILSCVPYAVCNYDVCHKYYESWHGTSMAAPHVAGACALVWSVNPSLSHLQVKDIILKSVDKLPSLDGLCVTEGRLNLYNALVETLKNEQILSNVDNIAEGHSVLPSNEITYTIHYANPVTNPSDPNYIGTLTNVSIIDYLPVEVDIQTPFDPAYNDANRTYTWNIGTLSPGSSGSFSLSVTVNNLAEPLGKIKNMCKMKSDQIRPVFATEVTDVNSWNPGIIYVSKYAPGLDTGMSWKNAYRDLQRALDRAQAGYSSAIWVAKGRYKPRFYWDTTYGTDGGYDGNFSLFNGANLFGHFAGVETSASERDLADANNEAILDGWISELSSGIYILYPVSYVVKAEGIENVIIDGFTIINSHYNEYENPYGFYQGAGIYLDGSSASVVNCKISENCLNGISAQNASVVDIQNCSFIDNISAFGLDVESVGGSGSRITVSNCLFQNNSEGICTGSWGYGIALTVKGSNILDNGDGISLAFTQESTIINNWIHDNYGNGIWIDYRQVFATTIRNNTIFGNGAYGVSSGSEDPIIQNCIIRGNTGGDFGGTLNNVNYCCLQTERSETTNIYNDPCFEPDNLHIKWNSPCRDNGDSNGIPPDETDIDSEGRIKYGRVDIGADEFWNGADFDESGIVDFIDYAIIANNWLLSCSGPNWCSGCDLDQSGLVNTADLKLFCDDWLWQPAWITGWMFESQGGQMMMAQNQVETGLQKIADETGSQIAIQEAEIEQEQIVLTEADVKEILEWMDAIEIEAEMDGLSSEGYDAFRQALEEDLLRMLESAAADK